MWWLILLLAVEPFWDTVAPEKWTTEEIQQLLSESPWAHPAVDVSRGGGGRSFLSTALPMRLAEEELNRRRKERAEKAGRTEEAPPSQDEFREYLQEKGAKVIVLAVEHGGGTSLADGKEMRHFEEESVLYVGKRKYKMIGHFPPSEHDPYLRIVFPREVTEKDKSLRFELYVPGSATPFREVEYNLKHLMFRGKLEM